MSECHDRAHRACEHAGWREVLPAEVGIARLAVAHAAAAWAAAQLGLNPIRVLFFERGPRYLLPAEGVALTALDWLNWGLHDPTQLGLACPRALEESAPIWIRAGLSHANTEFTVYHEARHRWQDVTAFGDDDAEQERDANRFALRARPWRPEELGAIVKEGRSPDGS